MTDVRSVWKEDCLASGDGLALERWATVSQLPVATSQATPTLMA